MGGKTSTESKNKWNQKTYDRLNIIVPKGKREQIKAYAESKGESLNGFVNRVINKEMESDTQKNF